MKLLLSIGVLSAMLLTVQLSLIQALSFVQGHHLAYVILSIALLGFGAGGSVLVLCRGVRRDVLAQWYAPLASLAGVSVAGLPHLARGLLFELEVDLLFTGLGPWLRLAGLGALLCIPFFLGALALSILFRTHANRIGALYAANLAGSALGAVAAIPLLILGLPEHVLPFCGALGVVAGFLGSTHHRWHAVCGVLVFAAVIMPTAWSPSPYRDLAYALQLPEVVTKGPYPHFYGRLDVVDAPALRHAPDVSLLYRDVVPSAPHLFVNGDRAGVLLDLTRPESRILAHTPQGLPYAVGEYAAILLLSPDGNGPVAIASDHSPSVQVVEPHPLVMRWLGRALPDAVQLVRADPRGYLARAPDAAFDLIVFPMRGLFGGPSGLQTLGSDSLFTTEGITLAFERLDADGWLAFPVWLDDPLRHSLRVLALIRSSLAESGIPDPAEHVIAVRGWGSVLFMVSRQPVTTAALGRAVAFADKMGFDLLHPESGELALRHGHPDQPPAIWYRALLGPTATEFLSTYRFDVRAPTDARPFFNQFLRPGDLAEDLNWLSVSERGLTVLYILLVQLLVAVLLIVFLPLWPLRKHMHGGAGTIGYFSGLGAGFMLYEIALIQLLISIWGTPVAGTAFVITTLLLGMSVGSWLGHTLPERWYDCRRLAGMACVAILIGGGALPYVIRWVLPYGQLVRFGVLFPLVLVPAVFLGMPFPCGIRYLARHAPAQIPWACGIDGGVAVLAAPLSAVLAFYAGYPAVVFIAASAYALSMLSTTFSWGTRGRLGA